MAILSEAQLKQNGIDLEAIKIALGPKKVENRKDGTVAIENHSLADLIKLMRYLRSINRSKADVLNTLSFAKVRPGDANGGYSRD